MARRDGWNDEGAGPNPAPPKDAVAPLADLPEAVAPSVDLDRPPGWLHARMRDHAAGQRHRLERWWHAAPDNLRGSVLMFTAFLFFAVMTGSIKAIGPRIPLPEVLVVRQIVMTIFLMPLFLRDLPGALRTERLGLQVVRGLFSLGAMLCGFTALTHIPMADATALGFSQVLFVTLAAVLVLKEEVGWRRWVATLVGFLGVLVMLKPAGGIDHYAMLSIAGAMFGCGITVTVRMLAQTERTATILLYQAIVLLAVLTLPAILWWVPPTPQEWFLLVLIGASGTAGQWLVTRAYQVGEAAALAPLDFVRLLIATGTGFFVFSEIPSLSTAVGAIIVVGATVYTVRRNATRKAPAPPAHSP